MADVLQWFKDQPILLHRQDHYSYEKETHSLIPSQSNNPHSLKHFKLRDLQMILEEIISMPIRNDTPIKHRINLKKSILDSSSKRVPLENSLSYQPIKEEVEYRTVTLLLLDCSTSMRHIYPIIDKNYFLGNYPCIYLYHTDEIIYWSESYNEPSEIHGSTSLLNPIVQMKHLLNDFPLQFHMFHYSDGIIHNHEITSVIEELKWLESQGQHTYTYHELSHHRTPQSRLRKELIQAFSHSNEVQIAPRITVD